MTYEEKQAVLMKAFETYEPILPPKVVTSPSGKYRLVITIYKTKPGAWNYSKGEIFCGDARIVDVYRNYGDFPFHWVEGHQNGDFLVCESTYQGQTVVNLVTGGVSDLSPTYALKEYVEKKPDGTTETKTFQQVTNSYGFCWVSMQTSPNKQVLAAFGCYWGGGYYVTLYDFRNPMNFPLPVLPQTSEDQDGYDWDIVEWKDDQTLLLNRTIEVRKSDGKLCYELEEQPPDDECEEKVLTLLWSPECLKEKSL